MTYLTYRRGTSHNHSRFRQRLFLCTVAFLVLGVVLVTQTAVRADDKACQSKDWFKSGLAWLYFNCGNTYDNIVRHDKAVHSYDEALQIVPDFVDAIDCRGYALVKIGRVEEALQDLNKVVATKPDSPLAYLHRSEAYSQAKQFDLATQDLERGIKLGAKESDVKHAREFMAIKQKELRK